MAFAMAEPGAEVSAKVVARARVSAKAGARLTENNRGLAEAGNPVVPYTEEPFRTPQVKKGI